MAIRASIYYTAGKSGITAIAVQRTTGEIVGPVALAADVDAPTYYAGELDADAAAGWDIGYFDAAYADGPIGSETYTPPASFYVTPVTATVGAGEVSGGPIVAYQNATATIPIAPVDAAGNAIPLAGKTLKFVAARDQSLASPVFTLDTTGGGITIAGNVATITLTPTHTAALRTLCYALWDVGANAPLAEGPLTIKPIAQLGA